MITLYRFSDRLLTVISLSLLTGCASVQFDDYLEDPAAQRLEVEQKSIRPKHRPAVSAPCIPAKSGWNQVTYQGEVVFSQGPGGPAARVRVALVEGSEELCSTVTDEKGCFNLTCDLYGKPFTSEDGVYRWCPEEYYALIATNRHGEKGKVLLRDAPYGERVRIFIE